MALRFMGALAPMLLIVAAGPGTSIIPLSSVHEPLVGCRVRVPPSVGRHHDFALTVGPAKDHAVMNHYVKTLSVSHRGTLVLLAVLVCGVTPFAPAFEFEYWPKAIVTVPLNQQWQFGFEEWLSFTDNATPVQGQPDGSVAPLPGAGRLAQCRRRLQAGLREARRRLGDREPPDAQCRRQDQGVRLRRHEPVAPGVPHARRTRSRSGATATG